MRGFDNLASGIAVIWICIASTFAIAVAAQYKTSNEDSLRSTRACVFAAGAAAELACTTAADADSGALTANTRYVMYCDKSAYVRFGTAAVTAAAGDMVLYTGSWLEFGTSDSIRHVSVKNVDTTGSCHYLECT